MLYTGTSIAFASTTGNFSHVRGLYSPKAIFSWELLPYRFKFIEPDIEWRNSDAGSEMLRSTDNFSDHKEDSAHFSGDMK